MKKHTVFGWLTALFAFCIPFIFSQKLFYAGINAKYFYIIFGISVLALIFVFLLWKRNIALSLKGRWLLFLLVGVLGIYYLSALFGVYPERSFFSEILRSSGVIYLTYVAVFAWMVSEVFKKDDWQLIRRAILFSGALYAFFTFFGPEGLGATGRFLGINFEVSALTFANTTFAGTYLLFVFVFGLIEFAQAKGLKKRLLVGIPTVLVFMSPILFAERIWRNLPSITEVFSDPTFLLGNARASSVTAFAIVLYLLGVYGIRTFTRKEWKLVLVWPIAWILVLGFLTSMLFVPNSFVQEKYIEISSGARVVVWESGLRAFEDRPILGWGPDNFTFASQKHFDNRLYEDDYLGEIWFDRAHNGFVDSLVAVGLLGVLGLFLLLVYAFRVLYRAVRCDQISVFHGHALGALLIGHIMQIQTGFNTVATYVVLVIVFGFILWLEKEGVEEKREVGLFVQKSTAVLLVLCLVVGAYVAGIKEHQRQKALIYVFASGKSEVQMEYIPKALSRTSDFETRRLLSSSFVKGLLAGIQEGALSEQALINSKEQLGVYVADYREYIKEVQYDYRARINYAYLLLIQTILGDNKLEEVQPVLEEAYVLSPQNPLTYYLDMAGHLYGGDLEGAQRILEEARTLDPDNPVTDGVEVYLEKQLESFPNITVLRLENL